eukprot:scaffold65051_cov65-Cyclotella_meneghiniana.AAC.2
MNKAPLHRQPGYDRLGKACTTLTNTRDEAAASILIRLQNQEADFGFRDGSTNSHGGRYSYTKLLHKLQSVHDKLSAETSLKDVSLYPRCWESTNNNKIFKRKHNSSSQNNFTVASFNTLARGLSSGPNSMFPTPFVPGINFDGTYGGFTNVTCPEVVLDYELRKWRLVQVLLGGRLANAGGIDQYIKEVVHGHQREEVDLPFDIMALQEVDDYAFWHSLLVYESALPSNQAAKSITPNGIKKYQGVFEPKPFSPCINFGWYSDGVALLWHMEKFQALARPSDDTGLGSAAHHTKSWIEMGSYQGDTICEKIPIHDSARIAARNQVYILAPLQRVGTNQVVIVAATHLKAKGGYQNESIRYLQAAELKYKANQMARTLHDCGWKNVSIIILGDFNSEPNDASVQHVLQRDVNSRVMQSAYNLNDESLYTTWKERKDGTVCRTIDYIFYSSHTEQTNKEVACELIREEILAVPKKESVGELFPGFRYPSDHLLIAAKFGIESRPLKKKYDDDHETF